MTSFSQTDFLHELKLVYSNDYVIVYNDEMGNWFLKHKNSIKKCEYEINYESLIKEEKEQKWGKILELRLLIVVLSDKQARKVLNKSPKILQDQLKIICNLPKQDFDVYIQNDIYTLEVIEGSSDE